LEAALGIAVHGLDGKAGAIQPFQAGAGYGSTAGGIAYATGAHDPGDSQRGKQLFSRGLSSKLIC
jgi:hypothetical protein